MTDHDTENMAQRHRFGPDRHGPLEAENPWGLRLAILLCLAFWLWVLL
jgi:hypothetical protein